VSGSDDERVPLCTHIVLATDEHECFVAALAFAFALEAQPLAWLPCVAVASGSPSQCFVVTQPRNEGRAAWAMHYRFSYLALRMAYKLGEELAAAGLVVGFLVAALRREPRCADVDVRLFVRAQQRLRQLRRRRGELIGSREEPSERSCDVLLAAVPGGHLAELWALRDAWQGRPCAWFTLRSEHSASLLAHEQVFWGRGPTRRSLSGLFWNTIIAWRVLRTTRPRLVIASGSGLTVPLAWMAWLFRVRIVFLECGGRVDRPSVSFRLIAPIADRIYVQSAGLAELHPHARYAGRVPWCRYEQSEIDTPTPPPKGTLITVGTDEEYPFNRLLEAARDVDLPKPITVQRGVSTVEFGETCFDFAPASAIARSVLQAELVVSHAGIGSVMLAVASARRLIVMPRSAAFGEAIDDHQRAFAEELAARGIAVVDTTEDLRDVVSRVTEIDPAPAPPPSQLVPELRSYLTTVTGVRNVHQG
jgi:UDP-N-acetylglucosamine--N-acetylmuramyl-(pentapeptide) pyrophosphoryl-undecaprenol N-acetylglucosamine transferase